MRASTVVCFLSCGNIVCVFEIGKTLILNTLLRRVTPSSPSLTPSHPGLPPSLAPTLAPSAPPAPTQKTGSPRTTSPDVGAADVNIGETLSITGRSQPSTNGSDRLVMMSRRYLRVLLIGAAALFLISRRDVFRVVPLDKGRLSGASEHDSSAGTEREDEVQPSDWRRRREETTFPAENASQMQEEGNTTAEVRNTTAEVRNTTAEVRNTTAEVRNATAEVRNTTADERKTNRTKLILFWTPRLGQDDWSKGVGTRQFRRCRYSDCEYTTDKARVDEADMLLFYCEEPPQFPARRRPHQLYVHWTKEAPASAKMNGYGAYGDVINATASYRKDCNLWNPYFFVTARPDARAAYAVRVPFANRSRSVVWMASNCHSDSGRELYVRELARHIDVDVYGACGDRSCDGPSSGARDPYESCFQMFETTYKFYLAFENNVCRDYYTEKLANPFKHEIVPIVFGGADYERDFPRRSLINAADFPNPKDLARYLSAMTERDYSDYLQWKARYRLAYPRAHCVLCEFLHDGPYARGERILPPAYGGNYSKWWHDSCHNDLINELRRKGHW